MSFPMLRILTRRCRRQRRVDECILFIFEFRSPRGRSVRGRWSLRAACYMLKIAFDLSSLRGDTGLESLRLHAYAFGRAIL